MVLSMKRLNEFEDKNLKIMAILSKKSSRTVQYEALGQSTFMRLFGKRIA